MLTHYNYILKLNFSYVLTFYKEVFAKNGMSVGPIILKYHIS